MSINNIHSKFPDIPAPVTALDWVLSPSPSDKKANCGKLTHITVYTSGTVRVKKFYCHRFDCPCCGAQRKSEIKAMIIRKSAIWYVTVISQDEFVGTQKMISRVGEKYCAVGTGNNILMMALTRVLPDAKVSGWQRLETLIEEHLDCEYDFRTRRFRHSNGLFPKKSKPLTEAHILKEYASSESTQAIVERFVREGYLETFHEKGHFLRPSGKASTVDEVLCAGAANLQWSE